MLQSAPKRKLKAGILFAYSQNRNSSGEVVVNNSDNESTDADDDRQRTNLDQKSFLKPLAPIS